MAQGGMTQPVQTRTLKTRARLLEAAREGISETSHGALRVEEVVRRAGVAKGTFFAHFKDKDALMDRLIGERMDLLLSDLEACPPPQSTADLVRDLGPFVAFMRSERYVFDVILRYSGAAAREEIGPIAATFERFILLLAPKLAAAPFRKDADPAMLAEGIQAFIFNALGLSFCALHSDDPLDGRLEAYFDLWLLPPGGATA